jgi:hypothetical protein
MTHVRKLAIVTTAFVLTVWAAGLSMAADQAASKSQPAETRGLSKASKAAIHTVTGTVSAVQPDAKTVEVKVPRGKAETLLVGAMLNDQTVIKEGKTRKSLADLKVGDHVWMKFERGSSGDIAKTIVIKPEKRS